MSRRSSGRSGTGFGQTSPGEDDEYPVHLLDRRALAWRSDDDDAIVATAGAYPFELTVPGGARSCRWPR